MSHRALSGQFGQQRLFDPGPAAPQPYQPEPDSPEVQRSEAIQAYNTEKYRGYSRRKKTNPLPAPPFGGDYESKPGSMYPTEFIPPWRVTSSQGEYLPHAVDHMVAKADPLTLDDDPQMVPYQHEGEEHYRVINGNHRTIAALKRGQLLMPARVERPLPES